MRSILDQLDNDEAVLLMFLAGELPPADRASVEQRLAASAQMREKLEALRACEGNITRLLGRLDASQPVSGSAASSQRMIVRLMKQWQAEQLLRGSRAVSQSQPRSKWIWIGPAAAAAVLLLAWGVWWGIQPEKYTPIADASSDYDYAADVVPETFVYPDSALDDSKVYASMAAELSYIQTLSELTTLRQ